MSLERLPDNSRVWFFGSDRLLNDEEKSSLSIELQEFVSSWKAHGAELAASFEILHDCILIVAVDESVTPPTGCSIDKVFKLLEKQASNWFNRLLIWRAFCNTAKIYTVDELQLALSTGELDRGTIIINSTVRSLTEVRKSLYISINDSWVSSKLVE
ncbi:MAG: hypothetical protein ACPGCV_06125 [Bacteroidia bacterium]